MGVPTALALTGSGCLGLLADSTESGRKESSLYLSNPQDVNHDVEVEIKNLRKDLLLVDETVTVTPEDSQKFYFPTGTEEKGRRPQIRATVRMVNDPGNEDSETEVFPPSGSVSLMATITETGEIEVTVVEV